MKSVFKLRQRDSWSSKSFGPTSSSHKKQKEKSKENRDDLTHTMTSPVTNRKVDTGPNKRITRSDTLSPTMTRQNVLYQIASPTNAINLSKQQQSKVDILDSRLDFLKNLSQNIAKSSPRKSHSSNKNIDNFKRNSSDTNNNSNALEPKKNVVVKKDIEYSKSTKQISTDCQKNQSGCNSSSTSSLVVGLNSPTTSEIDALFNQSLQDHDAPEISSQDSVNKTKDEPAYLLPIELMEKLKNLRNEKQETFSHGLKDQEISQTKHSIDYADQGYPCADQCNAITDNLSNYEDSVIDSMSQLSTYTTVSSLEPEEFDSLSLISQENEHEFETELMRLKSLLKHIDGNALKDYFREQVKRANVNFIRSLSKVLPEETFSSDTNHCVRCHHEYNPTVYGNRTCVIRHREKDVILISEDDESTLFECERCSGVFKLDAGQTFSRKHTPIEQCGVCVLGEHTNDTAEVDYQPEGVALTCVDKGCVVHFV